jgi:hypothetical protein
MFEKMLNSISHEKSNILLLILESWTSFVTKPKTKEAYIGQLEAKLCQLKSFYMLVVVDFETKEESVLMRQNPSPFSNFAGG